MMVNSLAYCGLRCQECPVLLASQADDDELRMVVARRWSKLLGAPLTAAEIDCEGCLGQGQRLFKHCQVCDIRGCCRDKGLENCAVCAQYPCAKLGEFLSGVPEARANLEHFRAAGRQAGPGD